MNKYLRHQMLCGDDSLPTIVTDDLLAAFSDVMAGSDVGISYYGNYYHFVTHALDDYYIGFRALEDAFVADAGPPRINDISVWRNLSGVEQESGDITRSGDWTAESSVNNVYYGQTYRRTNGATGTYASMTTPVGVTRVGAFVNQYSSGGIHLVEIDGDKTAATSLSTAQELVTAGQLDSTALVANGGTLNPTDRCYDQYAGDGVAAPFSFVEFADGLTSGSHVIKITTTGYKNSSSGNTRLLFAGFFHNAPGLTAGSVFGDRDIIGEDSRLEFAYQYTPSGGSTPDYIGHDGTEFLTSITLEIDDVEVSPAEYGATLFGDELKISIVAYLKHAESVPNVATCTRTLMMNPTSGWRIQHDLTWLVAGDSGYSYPVMLTLNNSFDRGANVAAAAVADLDNSDDSNHALGQGLALAMWQETTPGWGGLCYIPDAATMANWAESGANAWIQDRSGGTLNKVYCARRTTGTVSVNDNWVGDFFIRIGWFSDPDTTLSALWA